jgi:hypothetical protein
LIPDHPVFEGLIIEVLRELARSINCPDPKLQHRIWRIARLLDLLRSRRHRWHPPSARERKDKLSPKLLPFRQGPCDLADMA